MNSSGIKRGLAVSAVSALAVAGLPFLATSASATPIADQVDTAVNADSTVLYSGLTGAVSTKNDGTNTTVSLVAGGGSNVTSVQFQYSTNGGTSWSNIDAPVARNADGVFQVDWANPPATLTNVRAVPNTGETNADSAADTNAAATATTAELGTEGARGVFQAPYTAETVTGDYVSVFGTVSDSSTAVDVRDVSDSADTGGGTYTDEGTVDADGTGSGTTGAFSGILDITGYDYSQGTEANQIALNAATQTPVATDDAEGSSLYVQKPTTITVSPSTQEVSNPANAEFTLTVKDQFGAPVANAQVFRDADTDTDGAGADTDTDGTGTIVGYTDSKGQVSDAGVPHGGTIQYWVNTTDNNPYDAGIDPTTSATVTTYTPALTSVKILNNHSRTNYDIDELADGDDYTVQTQDQRGKGFDENLTGADVQYRWTFDPSGTGTTYTTEWRDGETDSNGKFNVPALVDADYAPTGELPAGTYTLEARRPNVAGSGLINATPENLKASESEITFGEGDQATYDTQSSPTVSGTLANADGGLGGRRTTLTYDAPGAGEDSGFAPQSEQPSGVTVAGNTATVVTAADGTFSVKLKDQAVAPNTTPNEEDRTLTADLTQETASDGTPLKADLGPNDPVPPASAANAADVLNVHFRNARAVGQVLLSEDNADFWNGRAPGALPNFDIIVEDANGTDYQDFPVTVTITNGYLTPDGGVAADGQDNAGDEVGAWKDLGQSEDVSTGDAASASIDASIGRDTGFDDNGLVTTTITATAGGKSDSITFTWDSSDPVNGDDLAITPMAGEPQGAVELGQTVKHNVFAKDQFGNLVGQNGVAVSDDTTDADFTTDYFADIALTDFVNSGSSVEAYGQNPTSQTISGNWQTNSNVFGPNGAIVSGDKVVTGQAPTIQWVEPAGPIVVNAALTLKGNDNGAADDSLFANAIRKTAGATVKLFRKRPDGSWKRIAVGVMNSKGNFRFKNVPDLNGNGKTRYKAVVAATSDTNRGVGKTSVR